MSAQTYYNEIDPYAAQWLHNLIDAGHTGRVGQLRAYGNSIVAPVADAFIAVYMDSTR